MITDNAALRRFEWMENGKIVFANYRREGDVFTLPHVEADPALRGTGAASRLIEGIAALARDKSYRIVPTCSYARAWFRRHPMAGDVLG
jgi:predicted GNAT family acetyltransferase